MTGRCADCRLWNRNGDPWEAPGSEDSDWEPRVTDKRKCLNVLHANRGSADQENGLAAPAIVTDGSGYTATFWTAPVFGCTSFEPLVKSEP
jgi:hypothetical protein